MTVDGESSQRVRELEKVIRVLKQEKEEAQKVNSIFCSSAKVYIYLGPEILKWKNVYN